MMSIFLVVISICHILIAMIMLLIYLSLRRYIYKNSPGKLSARDWDEILNGK